MNKKKPAHGKKHSLRDKINGTNVRIHADSHKRLLAYCDRTGIWMTRVLDDAINQHIERMDKAT